MSDLPKGWVKCKLSEFTSIEMGQSPKGEFVDDKKVGLPFYQGKTEFGKWYPIPRKYCSKPTKIAEKNDILLSIRAPVGPTNLCPEKSCIGRGLAAIRAFDEASQKYLIHYLRHIEPWLSEQGTGSTFKAISGAFVREIDVLVAPLNEQKRIADKLDSILAKVDRAQTRLDKIPGILKRFRQAVLTAATSGELTREWRGSGADVYTDITGLSIPVEWRMCTIEDIGVVKGGKRLPKGDELTEINTGFPYIRAGQLKHGTVVQGDSARNRQMFLEPETQKKIKRYTVNEGDVYLTIVGASIGDAGVIPRMLHQANLTENAAKITDFTDSINAEYLSIWLRSERLQELIQLEIKSGAQGKLALKRINTLPVPLPPVNEQNEITRVVGELLSYSDSVEKSFEKIKLRIDRLTQSILTKAFRGELVEQNAADEPADKLMERIKQQQLDAPKSVKKPRTTSKKVSLAVDSAERSAELEQPQSGILSLLKSSKGDLTAQQIIDQMSEKTFEQVDALFTELKRLLDSDLIIKVGAGEACAFKAVKR
ncbi:restriction endonuclease subunit S [Rheinheimera fenheensis]|uniref:restriction endonuclease subunit S n=1 Tax=Rheinheimera fenheensis TaxID=3152295 RepID=UPI00325F1345